MTKSDHRPWRRAACPRVRVSPNATRRGVATLWVILALPVVLCLLALIVETGGLLLARMQLLHALEAAALAGVDAWGDQVNAPGGSNSTMTRNAARARAVELFQANTIAGQSWLGVLQSNGDALESDNQTCTGSVVILGEVTGMDAYTFTAGTVVNDDYGVRTQATLSVNSVLANLMGITLGPFSIQGEATARYNGGQPQLIRVTTFICP